MAFLPQPSLSWRTYRRLVSVCESFFSPPDTPPDADILKLYNLPAPVADVKNIISSSVIIDLHVPESNLWNAVKPKTRKVIRQALRDGVITDQTSELSEGSWNSFRAAYQRLRNRKKNTEPLGIGKIRKLIERNLFVMTTSCDSRGRVLSWHTYIRSNAHVCLLNSVSEINPEEGTKWSNMVGRAHRLHHWQDIIHFKSQGIATYDLGGVYRGTSDVEQANIARFKTSFGGQPMDTFDAILPLTIKGRIALSLASQVAPETRYGAARF
jgi:hypothetical protein